MSRAADPSDPPPQASAPNTRVRTPATTAPISTGAPRWGAPGRPASARAAMSRTRSRAARRGASQAGSTITGESPSDAGSAPSLRTARTPKPMRADRREPEVSAGGRRPAAQQDDRRVRPERQPGQHGPVDEGEVLGDLRGGHVASVAARLASTGPEVRRWDSRPRHDLHLVRPQLLRGPDRRRARSSSSIRGSRTRGARGRPRRSTAATSCS